MVFACADPDAFAPYAVEPSSLGPVSGSMRRSGRLPLAASVSSPPRFEDPGISGINPHALGLGMMTDIKRISEEPTEEDRAWFPSFAGRGDWRSVLKEAWANYRDESFIEQFLSPKLMRDLKLFALFDDA